MYYNPVTQFSNNYDMPRLTNDATVRSTHDLVAKELAKRILGRVYAAGDLLPNEGDLIDEFRVSRTALRESLKTLAAKGLVVAKTKVGTKILPSAFWNYFDCKVLSWRLELGVDAEFLTRLYEARQAIEPAAAAMAATRRTDENVERMALFLEMMEREHKKPRTYAESDLNFHQEILRSSHNPFIKSFSSIIEASIMCAFEISAPIDSRERLARSLSLHRGVFEAIKEQRAAEASETMSMVIIDGIENSHIVWAPPIPPTGA